MNYNSNRVKYKKKKMVIKVYFVSLKNAWNTKIKNKCYPTSPYSLSFDIIFCK